MPVLVQIDVNDRLSLEQAVVENLHRVDLHPLEEAAAYQQLIDEFDLTHEQVAQRVGKSRANITNTLRLLQLGEAAQSALATSQITAGHARSLLAISDPNAQATMVARVIKNEFSVRATEEAVKSFLEPKAVVDVEPVDSTRASVLRGFGRFPTPVSQNSSIYLRITLTRESTST